MSKFSDITNRNELADFLEIPRSTLSYILYKRGTDNLYREFEIPKKSGGTRKIAAPTSDLKNIQKKLAMKIAMHLNNTSSKFLVSHAFQKRKSIISNAKSHRNKKYVLNIDLENYFDSFHFGRVTGYFKKDNLFSLSYEVATIIAQLTCYKGTLPQGAPTSPIISNLIAEILDRAIIKLAKKYKLKYTRYADDLTFSTNDKRFIENHKKFLEKLIVTLEKYGFKINEKKIRMQNQESRQTVTGLIVNKKINVPREYYKLTRSMAYRLYKEGSFEINNSIGMINQLEGRFAFINQLDTFNSFTIEKHNRFNFNAREKQYQLFLFYKYFYGNVKPLIITEGKTDILYIKAALKNLHSQYPELITQNVDGSFEYKVSFLKRSTRLNFFLGIAPDGADTMKNIYNFYVSSNNQPNYYKMLLKISNRPPHNVALMIFDNETSSGKIKKPLAQFINHAKLRDKEELLMKNLMIKLQSNLFLLTTPLVNESKESDMEDLFDPKTLSVQIQGKKFTKEHKYDTSKYFGKEILSKYIISNYQHINFDKFTPILDNIQKAIKSYQNDKF